MAVKKGLLNVAYISPVNAQGLCKCHNQSGTYDYCGQTLRFARFFSAVKEFCIGSDSTPSVKSTYTVVMSSVPSLDVEGKLGRYALAVTVLTSRMLG